VHEANGSGTDEPDIPDMSAPRQEYGARPDRPRGERSNSGPTAKVFIGVGKAHKIRPGDLVGAIANETHLSGKEIGPIFVADRYSIVGVPANSIDDVIASLQRTTIKGKKPQIRPYTENSTPEREPRKPFDRKQRRH
jgi:ATP-dependent RNA helicase DeaD